MTVFIDQTGRQVTIPHSPQRIISLVPSQTELLYDLGLEDRVVGITKFCVHPENWFRSKTRVGGTKKYDFRKIAALQPDLIIANKEENEQEQIESLIQQYPVWISDIKTLDDALNMIRSVGEITGTAAKAIDLSQKIIQEFSILNSQVSIQSAAYFIWKSPSMVAGADTFINEMLNYCGFSNAFAHEMRYPQITDEELRTANPDLILLSSEPYPFKEKHIEEFLQLCPAAKVLIVDGEMFSWYGSRLLQAPRYFQELKAQIS